MSFTLFLDGETPAIAARSPVIKAQDRVQFTEIVALLEEARSLRAKAADDYQSAKDRAAEQGFSEGMQAAKSQIEATIAELTARFDAFSEERRNDVAQAAYAAVQAIIGDMPDTAKMQGLVNASLSRIDGEAPVTIEVHPDWQESISGHVSGLRHITVKANDAMVPLGLNILSGQGKIVADLDLQMGALATRWGVAQ